MTHAPANRPQPPCCEEEAKPFFCPQFKRELYAMEHERVFGALFDYGQQATKAAIVLNGAASIAVLAFLGHVVAEADRDIVPFATGLVKPLTMFALGTASGAVIAASGWVAQHLFVRRAWAERFGKSFKVFDLWANIVTGIAVLLFLASMGLFVCGGIAAGKALDEALVAVSQSEKPKKD